VKVNALKGALKREQERGGEKGVGATKDKELKLEHVKEHLLFILHASFLDASC
jgi:hypothetical protein